MKKWFTFILLLVTLTGTLFPCCLIDDCNDEEIVTGKKENNQEPEGTCSPFFSCATCPGFAEISKSVKLVQPEPRIHYHYPKNVSFILSTYSASLLQPPQNAGYTIHG
jgi:hypothetical protein